MTRGTVRFAWGGRPMTAELTDGGWRLPPGLEALAPSLESVADPASFGPADGDPSVRALLAAADLLGGRAVYPPVADHPGRVY